jgi:hypothetical protein
MWYGYLQIKKSINNADLLIKAILDHHPGGPTAERQDFQGFMLSKA